MPETPTLFIAFKEANKYNEPEKSTIPKTKKAPDQLINPREKRSDKYPKTGMDIAAAIENTEIIRLTLK